MPKVEPKFNIHSNYTKVNILNPYRFVIGASYEPETINYMAAVGIADDNTVYYPGTAYETTGSNLWLSIDGFVKREKTASRWDKLNYIRPRIGGAAVAHGVNLKDPSTFIGTHFGGWVHDGFGSAANGSNAYMKTGYIASNNETLNSGGITATILSHVGFDSSYPAVMGAYTAASGNSLLYAPRNNTPYSFRYNSAYQSRSGAIGTNSHIGVRTVVKNGSTTAKHFHNGVLNFAELDTNAALPTHEYFEGSGSNSGTAFSYMNGRIGTTVAHGAFSDAEVTELHTSISQLESDLKRKNW